MSQIIEHGSDESNIEKITVSDKSTQVSIKQYQDIYHQITGRTEQIRKRYRDNFLIDFNEIKQLHVKIVQLRTLHKIIAENLSISVFHQRERKEQFTSFERFESYNSSTTQPTVSVVLKYNFSIIPIGLDKPQEYSITIRLNSKIALLKEFEEDAPPFIRGNMLGLVTEPIAEITVDYVDYLIARAYMQAFDEWTQGASHTKKLKWLEKIQENSSIIPNFLFIFSIFLIGYLSLKAIPKNVSDIQSMLRLAIIYLNGGVLIVYLNTLLGSRLERYIDSYTYLSYIHMNKGDYKLIEDFKNKQKSKVKSIVLFVLGNLVLSIIATKLEKLI